MADADLLIAADSVMASSYAQTQRCGSDLFQRMRKAWLFDSIWLLRETDNGPNADNLHHKR
jgi:hypothetical protein